MRVFADPLGEREPGPSFSPKIQRGEESRSAPREAYTGRSEARPRSAT